MNRTILLLLSISIVCIIALIMLQSKPQEGFVSGPQLHMYWIVSEKRKPFMLQQIRDKGLKDITFVPGIFHDTDPTDHPNLPKEWLSFPVARLLAAHMQALRLFYNSMQSVKDKERHMFVCMEDDIILHTQFTNMVQQSAQFLQEYTSPARILLGYVNPPVNAVPFKRLSDTLTIYKPQQRSGDPWGAQCYMLNYAYVEAALKHYEKTYTTQSPRDLNVNADAFLFEIPSEYFLLDPPACLEDHPTFGTMLGHTWNSSYFKAMVARYNRDNYYRFSTN